MIDNAKPDTGHEPATNPSSSDEVSDEVSDVVTDLVQPTEAQEIPVTPGLAHRSRTVSPASRIVTQALILTLTAVAGSFGGGYFVMERAVQQDRDRLLEQQAAAQDRIAALERQIAELRQSPDRANSVQLDLTELFEPIRETVTRIAMVRLKAISHEITTQLTNAMAVELDDGMPVNQAAVTAPADRDGVAAEPTTDSLVVADPPASTAGVTVAPVVPAAPLSDEHGDVIAAPPPEATGVGIEGVTETGDRSSAVADDEARLLGPVATPRDPPLSAVEDGDAEGDPSAIAGDQARLISAGGTTVQLAAPVTDPSSGADDDDAEVVESAPDPPESPDLVAELLGSEDAGQLDASALAVLEGDWVQVIGAGLAAVPEGRWNPLPVTETPSR